MACLAKIPRVHMAELGPTGDRQEMYTGQGYLGVEALNLAMSLRQMDCYRSRRGCVCWLG